MDYIKVNYIYYCINYSFQLMGCTSSKSYLIGSIYHNHYKIIQKINFQPKCQFYLVEEQNTKTIKKLNRFLLRSSLPTKILSLLQKIRYLDHPNIIKIDECHQYQEEDDFYYLGVISEHILQTVDLISSLGKLNNQQIEKIYQQIKSALQFLHKNNIVYKDLALKSIFLDKIKNVKLSEIPLIQIVYDYMDGTQRSNSVPLLYKSPQTFNDQSDRYILTPKFDIWALGVVMVQLSTGLEFKQLIIKINKQNYSQKKQKKYLQNNQDGSEFIHSALNENFTHQTFLNLLNIKSQFQAYIKSLLKLDPNERQFYLKPPSNLSDNRIMLNNQQKDVKNEMIKRPKNKKITEW